jgi:site-specific recombinase XerD
MADRFVASGVSVSAARARRHAVAAFERSFSDLSGWGASSVDARRGANVGVRGFAAWLALSSACPVDAAYVVVCASSWGYQAAAVFTEFAAQFRDIATRLGFTPKEISLQWATAAKLTTVAGLAPGMLDRPRFDQARTALRDELLTIHGGRLPLSFTTPLHGLQATLTAMGVLDVPESRNKPDRGRRAHWDRVATQAPALAATMRRYLSQVAISLRPGSVAVIDTSLRQLADYLLERHQGLTAVAGIGRTHIEGFKAVLAARTGYRGRSATVKTTIGMRLGNIRSFFDRIIEWGYDDAPVRNPVFAGDMPIKDQPLPRFLDDADAAKLLTAARALPDVFDRVCVEVLARTGLRRGEFLGLTIDAIVRMGTNDWLRTPVGKLHTDRYIPLHPRVKTLLNQWLAGRGDQPRTTLMFVERGRPMPASRVDRAVTRAAAAGGLGHVHPHQLRHTLATQAINRGMSLEAIAALLGHKSMSMTMTYARIADRTVAEEYFAVTGKVEALYDASNLPADAEGPNMRRLHAEASRRLLGNGYCTRPAEIGCRYETICEGCSFFATTITFRDQIQAQHDDAHRTDDHGRKTVYSNLLQQLDQTGT